MWLCFLCKVFSLQPPSATPSRQGAAAPLSVFDSQVVYESPPWSDLSLKELIHKPIVTKPFSFLRKEAKRTFLFLLLHYIDTHWMAPAVPFERGPGFWFSFCGVLAISVLCKTQARCEDLLFCLSTGDEISSVAQRPGLCRHGVGCNLASTDIGWKQVKISLLANT